MPTLSQEEIANIRLPLRMALLGFLLVLVDLPIPVQIYQPALGPPERGYLLIDPFFDFLGLGLAAAGMLAMLWLRMSARCRRALLVATALCLIGLIGAAAAPLWFNIPALGQNIMLAYGLVEIEAVILFALSLSWLCRGRGRPAAARLWTIAARVLLLCYALPYAGFVVANWLYLSRGQHRELQPLLLILFPVMWIPVAQLHAAMRHTLANDDNDQHSVRQAGLVWRFGAVIYLVAIVLITALGLAYRHRPRQRSFSLLQLIEQSTQQQQQKPQPFWRRWLDPERESPGTRPPIPNVNIGPANSEGAMRVQLDPKHLALRETADAQLILLSQLDQEEKKAREIMETANAYGPFRQHEEVRFVSRVFLQKFIDDQKDKEVLKQFEAASTRAASSDYSSFEDHFYAGVSSLLTGNAEQAQKHLNQAMLTWPSKGRGYGNVYLYLMLTHAARGNSKAVLNMLAAFKARYPDWLYVETFLTDIADIEKVYPRAELLRLVRGRLMYHTLNYAAAAAAWRQALDSGRLERIAARKARAWLAEVEKERPR